MTFDEEFPSLKYVDRVQFKGLIRGDLEPHFSASTIQEHLLDKQRVREAIGKISREFDLGMDWEDDLLKELGL